MMKNNNWLKVVLALLTVGVTIFLYIQKLDQDRMARIENKIDELAQTSSQIRMEIQAISNFAASSTVEIENVKTSAEKNEERINELYRILNR